MSKNKMVKQKLIRTTEEVALLITELASELEMTESVFVTELVRNYAIDCKKLEGAKNYHLIEKMEIPTYVEKHNQKEFSEDMSQVKRELKIMKSILNSLNEYEYTARDLLNAIMIYLRPEENASFASTDTKLSLVNKSNLHSFLEESIKNYQERIRREQINNAGI